MPISIAALTANRRTIKVSFGDDFLSVIYKPSAINARQEARENEERAEGKHILSAARSLAEIIHGWDLVDDAGKPVPPSEEASTVNRPFSGQARKMAYRVRPSLD